jgi:nitroreductase
MSAWSAMARRMVARAALAPSSHNTQPWFFRLSPTGLELWADRTRALPVNDPEDRELAISCGCALLNLRLAAAGEGVGVDVALLPAAGEPDRLARVTLRQAPGADAEDTVLAAFMEQRRTYRKRFAAREVSAEKRELLVAAAQREGAQLLPLLADTARDRAAELVAEGDAEQWANPSWRRELAAWMHPRRRGDGLTVPAMAVPVAQLVVRTFDLGGGVGAKDQELATGSPLLAVLATDGDHPRAWLGAGQALQRVLLVACQNGLQASYLNQPIQVPVLRPRLQDLAGGGFPQLLLRLGYPLEEVPVSPRRTLAEVLEEVPEPTSGEVSEQGRVPDRQQGVRGGRSVHGHAQLHR